MKTSITTIKTNLTEQAARELLGRCIRRWEGKAFPTGTGTGIGSMSREQGWQPFTITK